MPYNEKLAEQILDAAAKEWPDVILNMVELKAVVPVENEQEALSTIDGLAQEGKVKIKPYRSGSTLMSFVGLRVTLTGRAGREQLTSYNVALAKRILHVL